MGVVETHCRCCCVWFFGSKLLCARILYNLIHDGNVKVKFNPEQTTKALGWIIGVALLFL
jgi:hypothetical protein